jgi:MFS superfamily sulfate permease-like transporter
MPGIYVPSWPGWDTLGKLVVPVAVISLVSFIETAASAKQDNAALQKGWDQNQDLIGQGMAKLAAAVSGAFPTSSSFSRSALNLYAGAQTGWANVMAVGLVLVTLLWLLPLLHHVPQAVLAAVVVLAVLGLVKPGAFVRIWRTSRVEAAIAAATFGITLLTAPRMYWGILTGVLLTLSHFLYVRLHPRIIEVGLHPDGRLRDRHLWKLPPVAPRTCALRMDAELDFGSASALEHAITTYLVDHPDTLNVMLFAQPINRIDATGVEVFGRLRHQAAGGTCAAPRWRAGRSTAAAHVPHRCGCAAGPARAAWGRGCRRSGAGRGVSLSPGQHPPAAPARTAVSRARPQAGAVCAASSCPGAPAAGASAVVRQRDGHDARQAQRAEAVRQHGPRRLQRVALAAVRGQEGKADVRVVQPRAAHQAAEAHGRARSAPFPVPRNAHPVQAVAVLRVHGQRAVAQVVAGVVGRAHASGADNPASSGSMSVGRP